MEYKFSNDDLQKINADSTLYQSFVSINKKYEKQLMDSFFQDVSNFIHNHTKMYYREKIENSDIRVAQAKECLVIAIKLFNEFIAESNLGKLFISLHILSFFDQDYKLIDISKITREQRGKIINAVTSIDLKISVPENAPYNEKKMLNIFNTAKKANDYCEVIGIMDNLIYHSQIFERLNYTWAELIRFAAYLDKTEVITSLDSSIDYEKTEIFLYILRNFLFDEPSFIITLHNKYTVIRCLKYWFDCLESKYGKTKKLYEISDYTNILENIFLNQELNIEQYLEVMRLQHLESYNYLIGWLLAKNPDFVKIYLNHVSFGVNETVAFSDGFLFHISMENDESITRSIIEAVKSNFFDKEVHEYTEPNFHTGYLNLFVYYYSMNNRDKNNNIKELHNFSEKIQIAQNSWNHGRINLLWIELFYCCLSNSAINHSFSESELKLNIPVLYDIRNELIYDSSILEVMKKLLASPKEHMEIKMKNITNDYTIKLN